MAFHILPTTPLHEGVERLRAEASEEGFRFVDRLVREWADGRNRFDQRGEVFLGAFSRGELIGVCGLNRDPYVTDDESVGRLRHLYVRTSTRRTGVASALVTRLLMEARVAFRLVRLRAPTPEAAAFYLNRGFAPVVDETATHVTKLWP